MRQAYINNQVLKIYRSMDIIEFPIRVENIIKEMPSCKIMAYSKLAKLSGSSIADIINLAQSESGCTQYDRVHDRFLILYNDDNSNVDGRVRFTKAHEVGHVVLEHFAHLECNTLSENGLSCLNNTEIEQEADAFASTLLAPFPIAKDMGVSSAKDFEIKFGLSKEAAKITMERFLRWKASHRKTAWENDIKNAYRSRLTSGV